MRTLLCQTCATGKSSGSRLVYARTLFDPAEYERFTCGIARQPTVAQRTIYVNDVPQPVMDLAFYNCDLCFAEIRPGDLCAAHTAWTERQSEPPDWESAYLEKPDANSSGQTPT